jgi:hypothetical protein
LVTCPELQRGHFMPSAHLSFLKILAHLASLGMKSVIENNGFMLNNY